MTGLPPFPPTPVPEVEAQVLMDRMVASYNRPTYFEWDWREGTSRRLLSYVEWSVPCSRKGCLAPVGEPCNGRSGLHARRTDDWHRAQQEALGRTMAAARGAQPWYRALQARVVQRRTVSSLVSTAYNQTLANDNLATGRAEALALGVSPAMVHRAVAHGHQRARRKILKGAAKQAEWRAGRVKRAEEEYRG